MVECVIPLLANPHNDQWVKLYVYLIRTVVYFLFLLFRLFSSLPVNTCVFFVHYKLQYSNIEYKNFCIEAVWFNAIKIEVRPIDESWYHVSR